MSSAYPLPRLRRPAPTSTLRLDVCPPDVLPARDTVWVSLLRWLVGNDVEVAPVLRSPLDRARVEFTAALEGLLQDAEADADANDLASRVTHARSLRELWHLRSELYTLIAQLISQPEADCRLARINRHFLTRAQRSALPNSEQNDAR